MLSKSDLQSLRQCRRKLWLEHRRPELVPADEPTTYRRAVDGRIVGEKAREALGPNVVWPPGSTDQDAAAARAAAMLAASPGKPAVEFPMLRDGLYARADALVPEGSTYVLQETKSSTFPLKADKVTPKAPEDHHVEDVAIQAWVMQGSGPPMGRLELNLLDSQWRYPGGGDYRGLFRTMDVTSSAAALSASVPAWIADANAVLAGGMPSVQTGRQCQQPYDCPFHAYCLPLDPPGPEHPSELLPGSAGKRLAKKLHQSKGYVSLLEPQSAELTGNQSALFRRMQEAHRLGTPVFELGSEAILNALPYPRYFLDFEGIDLPVPRWAGVRPYEHIPFQWSCHIERNPGVFEHAEFLDLTGDDPSVGCIERMFQVIDRADNGPILVYHKTYEEGRLAGLAERHPQHAVALQNYIARIVDLLPMVRDFYYHPAMRGSFSMKRVLPVIAPDLRYDSLDEVQEGTAAQVAYLYATLDPSTTPERKTDLEHKLRAYCRQDTWAMVEVAYFLSRQSRPLRPQGM
jgi:hypothetical protein